MCAQLQIYCVYIYKTLVVSAVNGQKLQLILKSLHLHILSDLWSFYHAIVLPILHTILSL